jgi:hypothetical protein
MTPETMELGVEYQRVSDLRLAGPARNTGQASQPEGDGKLPVPAASHNFCREYGSTKRSSGEPSGVNSSRDPSSRDATQYKEVVGWSTMMLEARPWARCTVEGGVCSSEEEW